MVLYFEYSEVNLAGADIGLGEFGSPGERGQPRYDSLQKGEGKLSWLSAELSGSFQT